MSSLQKSVVNDVQPAILGHYTAEDVSKATDLLGVLCSACALLGDRHRRRCSVKCPVKSRLCQDLLEALVKLDKQAKMPRIIIGIGLVARVAGLSRGYTSD